MSIDPDTYRISHADGRNRREAVITNDRFLVGLSRELANHRTPSTLGFWFGERRSAAKRSDRRNQSISSVALEDLSAPRWAADLVEWLELEHRRAVIAADPEGYRVCRIVDKHAPDVGFSR